MKAIEKVEWTAQICTWWFGKDSSGSIMPSVYFHFKSIILFLFHSFHHYWWIYLGTLWIWNEISVCMILGWILCFLPKLENLNCVSEENYKTLKTISNFLLYIVQSWTPYKIKLQEKSKSLKVLKSKSDLLIMMVKYEVWSCEFEINYL